MTTSIVPGSLTAIAQQNGASIAEAFIGADYIIIVDTSGSMEAQDAPDNRQRYQAACDELAKLQKNLPGKIAVISFSSSPVFCANGIPTFLRGGTDLAEALRFVRIADALVERFIVISDGYPDNADNALREAKRFTTTISTVYVGPEGDRHGAEFLAKLAQCGRGETMVSNRVQELADKVQQLLLTH